MRSPIQNRDALRQCKRITALQAHRDRSGKGGGDESTLWDGWREDERMALEVSKEVNRLGAKTTMGLEDKTKQRSPLSLCHLGEFGMFLPLSEFCRPKRSL
jgi:hypothetical protein